MEKDVRVKNHSNGKGIYWVISQGEERLATRSIAPGRTVYNEKLFRYKNNEYRLWNPYRSKLAAFILNGGSEIPIQPNYTVLYLGAGSGTTVSHVSDIIGEQGKVYSVEFSARVMRVLLDNLCKYRKNIYPILGDARFPERYPLSTVKVDALYCDVAQQEQAKILTKNARMYLKKGSRIMIAIKARSIDVSKAPDNVFKKEIKILKNNGFKILQNLKLEPFIKDHLMVVGE